MPDAVDQLEQAPQLGLEDAAFERRRHQTIKRVTQDMIRYRYNTALATLMAYLNYLKDSIEMGLNRSQWRSGVETLARDSIEYLQQCCARLDG